MNNSFESREHSSFEIIDTVVILNTDTELLVTVVAKHHPNSKELGTLYGEGGPIFKLLVQKEWIDKIGTVLRHFRMDEVRSNTNEDGTHSLTFHYFLRADG